MKGSKSATSGKVGVVAQLVDVSQAQQDVTKDFLIGSRAAWQDINWRGGVKGCKVSHQTFETNGASANHKKWLGDAVANPDGIVLSGSVRDRVAHQLLEMSRTSGVKIAHTAPRLQNFSTDIDDQTFPIFAGRQA